MSAFRPPGDVRPQRYALRFDLDLDAWRFRGHESCDLLLDRGRREIVLHAVDLDISGVAARSGDRRLVPRLVPHAADETVSFVFDEELAAGSWTLELDLAGEIRADLKALNGSSSTGSRASRWESPRSGASRSSSTRPRSTFVPRGRPCT